MLKTIYKICSNFSENAFFRIAKKKSVFQEISTFSVCFSLVDLIIHICIKTRLKMRLSNVFSKNLHFSNFSPQNYAFHNRHFKYCWTEVHEHTNDF